VAQEKKSRGLNTLPVIVNVKIESLFVEGAAREQIRYSVRGRGSNCPCVCVCVCVWPEDVDVLLPPCVQSGPERGGVSFMILMGSMAASFFLFLLVLQ